MAVLCVRPHATNLEPKQQKITAACQIYTNLNNLKENSIILSSFETEAKFLSISSAYPWAAETKRFASNR